MRHASQFAAALTAFLISASGLSQAWACVSANIYAVTVEVCANQNGVTWTARLAGQAIDGGQMQPFYDAEKGGHYTDESYVWFSVPGAVPASALRFRVRVLRIDRGPGFFGTAGDVIYETALWNPGKYVNCPIPDYGDLGSHCWDQESYWISLGRL